MDRTHEPASAIHALDTSLVEVDLVSPLLAKGFLNNEPQPWDGDNTVLKDDLVHVREMFCAQVPEAAALGVYRIENLGLARVHEAVRATMATAHELDLWHGTTAQCARNIVLGGFNRTYSGRHGTRLGQGTYFSTAAGYSLRFCGRKHGQRQVMFLARVTVGACTTGQPDLIEPPYRDIEQMVRYDTTVDNVESPSMFCVFRDFQAVPRYLVEFAGLS